MLKMLRFIDARNCVQRRIKTAAIARYTLWDSVSQCMVETTTAFGTWIVAGTLKHLMVKCFAI